MEEASYLYKPINHQPSEQASFLSKLFFCWAPPLFFKSYGKNIKEDYYVSLDSHKAENLGNIFEKTWKKECDKRTPRLWRVIWKVFWIEFVALCALFTFSEFALKMTEPLLIGKLLSQQSTNTTTNPKENYYIYGSLIVLSKFLCVIISHFYQLHIQHLGMKIRIGCCSLIYRKTLKINKKTLAEANVGNVINLLSNDVNRFDLAAMYIVHLFIAPLETIIIIYSLYVTIGVNCILGIILLLLFVPLQMFLAKLIAKFRRKTAKKTDRRISLIEEIVSGIQVIKMFTWEEFFKTKVTLIRQKEISQILKASYIKAFNVSSMLFLNRFGIYLCIISYALTTNEVDAAYVFVVSSFYALLRQTVTVYFPFGIQNFSETKIALQRIETFLKTDETEITKIKSESVDEEKEQLISNCEQNHHTPTGVYLRKVSVKWKQSSNFFLLQNIDFQATGNEFVVITGPVGSGKSTLLYTIMKELPYSEGLLEVNGSISYASQEPWLFSGSIRQNILFGAKFDDKKYREIIRICQLEKDFSSLENQDSTLVGEHGALLSGGQKVRINLARALYREADIYLLDDPLAAVDVTVAQKIFQNCILNYLKNKCRILVTHHSSNLINTANNIYLLDKGILANLSHKKIDVTNNNHKNSPAASKIAINYRNLKKKLSETNQNNKSFQNYKNYAAGGCDYCIQIILVFLFIATQLAASGVDYFVAFWSNLNTTQNQETFFELGCYIYSFLIVFLICISVIRSVVFFKACVNASKNLQNQMLARIVSATMLFFETNSRGKILNRFSKDLGFIDETLPSLLMDAIQVALIVTGSVVLVAMVNPWMLMPTFVMFSLFYLFKTRFLARSRNMKRLEAEARSPIYSHTNATIEGLATIRTFKVQNILKHEFDYYQDLHSSAFYMFLTCNRAFGFWLDMNCVFYILAVTLGVMLIDMSAGNVGLCITQGINLIGVLQWGIRQWSELENQMINVERVVEYTKIPLEEDKKRFDSNLKMWPFNGEIKFESVFLKYYDKSKPSLENIDFTIKSEEKVGIVGRTGAGKSSLIAALFRLYNFEGSIFIDGRNIKNMPLQELRSKISVIPQDPTLFSISLRDNIDPYKEFNDEEIWKVLEQVNLKKIVLELQQLLNHKVLQRGSNFSVGQKQLICLARAILRNNKIVVLDEATANIDLQTDILVQQTVRNHFKNCTIITVAHRLNNILESDRILTVDNGSIVEFDRPDILLQNPKSLFSKLIKENCANLSEFEEDL